jgi:thioredoxin-related protein
LGFAYFSFSLPQTFIEMKLLISFCFISLVFTMQAQQSATESPEINWMSMDQAIALQKSQPKIILVDMFTDWCGWCTKMDATTFKHAGIVQYINQNFYPVKFNAEGRDSVMYQDSMFISSGPPSDSRRQPPHNLAKHLLNGRLSYPSLVFIDEGFNHYPIGGYRDVPAIEPLLIYFAERIYKTAGYQEFELNFNKTFRPVQDSIYPELQGKVEWLSFEELPSAMQKEPRKILLHIYHETTRGSMVMTATTLTNPIIADFINEKYYALNLNVISQDSIDFLDQKFGNQQQAAGYPHDLAIALLQPQITVPSTIFLAEDYSLIYALRGYASASLFELYLAFINANLYKNGDSAWAEFTMTYERKIK